MHNQDKPTNFIPQKRRDQMYNEQIKDPYQTGKKLPEPTHCTDCGAVYHKGRWQWMVAQKESHPQCCPACERIRDKFPASFLALNGQFYADHKEEILNLIKHQEEKEQTEHPLERIMDMNEEPQGELTISYTGVHLAQGTGNALHHAYQGEIKIEHNERSGQIRVHWQR